MATYPDFSGTVQLTPNFGYKMPGDDDRQDQIPFNENFWDIDAELKALSNNIDLLIEDSILKTKINTIETNINNNKLNIENTNKTIEANKLIQESLDAVQTKDIAVNKESIDKIETYKVNGYLINSNPALGFADVGAVGMPEGKTSQRIYDWALAETKPTYKYSEIQELPYIPINLSDLNDDVGYLKVADAQTTYFTIDAANNLSLDIQSRYALKSEIPTVPTNVSAFNNDAEYTTMTAVEAKGYLTNYTETDPTVPAWAKASTKPSYNFSEIIDTTSGNSLLTVITDLQSKIQNLENRIIELEGGSEV